MSDLFGETPSDSVKAARPLADRMRPTTLTEVVGQDHLLGENGVLTRMLVSGTLGSLIFWGPPGTGKTTVARLLADESDHHFEQLSAVFSGVSDLNKTFESARMRATNGTKTLLFVDEIHRFNRAQQDSFFTCYGRWNDNALLVPQPKIHRFELNAAVLFSCQGFNFQSP